MALTTFSKATAVTEGAFRGMEEDEEEDDGTAAIVGRGQPTLSFF